MQWAYRALSFWPLVYLGQCIEGCSFLVTAPTPSMDKHVILQHFKEHEGQTKCHPRDVPLCRGGIELKQCWAR